MQENTVNQFAHFDCLQCLFSHIVEWEGDKCCNKGIKCCQPNPGLTVFQLSPHCLSMTRVQPTIIQNYYSLPHQIVCAWCIINQINKSLLRRNPGGKPGRPVTHNKRSQAQWGNPHLQYLYNTLPIQDGAPVQTSRSPTCIHENLTGLNLHPENALQFQFHRCASN